MKPYDPTLYGAVTDLRIDGAGTAVIDGTYRIDNLYSNDTARSWSNLNGRAQLIYESTHNRWELRYHTLYGIKVGYYAYHREGYSPWNLAWTKGEAQAPVPNLTYGGIDLRFIDILPSYTSDLHDVPNDIMLRRCIEVLTPHDSIQDGATTI